MSSKRYLSEKRRETQNISISPALKDWIIRYVKKMQKENPDDERYKSVSSFYCYVMDKVMSALSEGKDIEDIDRITEKKLTDYLEQLSFKAFIPIHEPALKLNRYNEIDYETLFVYYASLRQKYMYDLPLNDYYYLKICFNRVKEYLKENYPLKTFDVDIFPSQKKAVFEFSINERNIHYENCKYMAGLFGYLGARIINMLYTPESPYIRFDLEITELVFSDKILKKQRLALMKENLRFLVNYCNLIKDEPKFLWIKLAEDNNVFINFKDEESFHNWLDTIKKDILQYGAKEELGILLAKFFSNLKWINLDEEILSFQLNLDREKYRKEINYIINTLSEYFKIKKEGELYYLESKRF
ncbi:MAG: hypothetical protein ACP6IY_07650 [Promethearchaeia archaeon]